MGMLQLGFKVAAGMTHSEQKNHLALTFLSDVPDPTRVYQSPRSSLRGGFVSSHALSEDYGMRAVKTVIEA